MQTMPASPAAAALTVRLGHFAVARFETLILVLAIAAALISAFLLWRMAQLENRKRRLEALRVSATGGPAANRTMRPKWYGRLGEVVAASPIVGRAEQQKLLDKLTSAGLRGHGRLATLVASKVCAGMALVALACLFLAWHQWLAGSMLLRSAVLLALLFIGWRLPDFALARLAARRQRRIEEGMPDAIDLLVICAESGLSLDQAIDQVSRDLRLSHREIAAECEMTAAEMRVLSDRAVALENLVRRTNLDSLRSITATLTQAIRFGTPLAESMRILAAEMRISRMLRIEERAARLPVLLTIPLMIFIMPTLFIVIGTPVGLQIYDFFKHMHSAGGVM
jgi:tight adherence protein C